MAQDRGWNETTSKFQKDQVSKLNLTPQDFMHEFLAFSREFAEFDDRISAPSDEVGIGPVSYNFTIKARRALSQNTLNILSQLVTKHKELADIILEILSANRFDTWEGDVPNFIPFLERTGIRVALQE
jgi:hypothetical protein